MSLDLIADFIESLGLLVTLSLGVALLEPMRRNLGQRLLREAVLGSLFGGVIVLVMIHPVVLPIGATFDPRGGPAIMAGVLGGPISAAIAAVVGAAGRYYLVGGPFAFSGALGFLCYGIFGCAVWFFMKRYPLSLNWRGLGLLGVLGTLSVLPVFFVGVDVATALQVLKAGGPILLANNIISTLIVGFVLAFARQYINLNRELEERRQEDAMLSLVARETTNMVIITDANGVTEWVNDGFLRMTGYDISEVVGTKPGALLQGPDTDPEIVRHMSQCISAGEGFHVEVLNYSKTGRPFWLEIRCQPIREPGQPLRFIAIESDVTSRKEALVRANQAEQTLLTAIESIEDAFALFDSRDRLVLANSKYKEYYSLCSDILEPGAKFEEILRIGAERGQFDLGGLSIDQWIEDRMRAHSAGDSMIEQRLGNGRWLKISERKTPDGGTVGFRVDITELKVAQQAAEQANRAKSEFLASMSHEIRTPMTSVMGLADLLLEDDLRSESEEKVRQIKNATNALLGIINDILDLSKMDASKLKIESIETEPRQLIEDVVQMFRQTAAPGKMANLDLIMETDDRLPKLIRSDPTRLRQILVNLVGNAMKFTESGAVTVRASTSADDAPPVISFQIIDSGIGIAADALDALFDDFTQGDASITRNYQGSGLGLSICKRLITLMGGEIGVESELGKGSTFWFKVPFDRMEEAGTAQLGSGPDAQRQKCPSLSILVAEDAELNRMIIGAIVSKLGHRVICVENGAEAVAAVEEGDFDLVLMDVRMPVLSGPDATRRIRKLPGPKSRTPIIALTADVMEESKAAYFSAGMSAFVAKPINPADLARTIVQVYRHDDSSSERRSSAEGLAQG